MATDYAARARALVGTRFRPQGRDPELGLDCVGLVLATFGMGNDAVRRNYRLRGDHRAEIERSLAGEFRKVGKTELRAGDLMLLAVTADQFHFAVRTVGGFVHADARIGRMVESPGAPSWPLIGVYRKRARRKG